MALGSPTKRLAVAGAVLALAAAACGGGGGGGGSGSGTNGGSTTNSSGSGVQGKTGGTLYIPLVSDFEHLDPARNYVNTSQSFGRLIYRTLTTYKAVPGKAGSEIVGDLAKNTGTPSNGARTWTFPLKQGLKFEDGTPIKCADIKYGIERAFDPDLTGGPLYIQQFLANVPKNYQGPKKSGKELPNSSIDCSNPAQIVFHLNQPVGDFNYTAALDTTVPVPRSKDTGIQYDNHPVSSGPYKIQTYDRGKQIILVRNKYWKRSTDSVRGAYPDKIEVDIGVDQTVLDRRLISDSGNDKNAVMFDSAVQPADLAQVLNNPQVKQRATNSAIPFVEYVAINTKKVKSLAVRKALEYAMNKETYRTALGGVTAGKYASTPSLPSVLGTPDLSSLYKAPPTGDVAKAKQILKQAGVKTPVKLTLQVSNSSTGQRTGTAVQAGLARGNLFHVNVQQLPRDNYYTTIGTPDQEADIVRAGWGADWPSLSTVLPPLFSCEQLSKVSNGSNYSQFCDKSIDAKMKQIEGITDQKKAAQQWGQLEKTIMEQAPIVPILYLAQVGLVGSNVRNAYYAAAYGCYDLVSISLAS